MHKIIIVDDHSLFREGIKLLIENEGLGKVIAEAENGKQFIELLNTYQPDLVIMDIEMPVMNGVEATRMALQICPGIKILALTMLNEKANYIDMLQAGASGFVLKTSGKVEFEKSIHAIINGESYLSLELLQKFILDINLETQLKNNLFVRSFTKRENEVLTLLCKGLSVNEIAEKLFLSHKTVETHRSALLKKTATKNTINLILYALKNKIVEL